MATKKNHMARRPVQEGDIRASGDAYHEPPEQLTLRDVQLFLHVGQEGLRKLVAANEPRRNLGDVVIYSDM